ncbi:MAG: disulfide bond formation protein B [Gammaproteobacteria bacterium]|nr:disulfide bond formation protein B [Gammaproteobacteria bacterium]
MRFTSAQRRWLNLAGAGSVVGLIAYALFAQYVLDLDACPLCILQRVAFIAAGLVFLAAGLHGPSSIGARVYAALGVVAAGTGAGIAARHVYIQNLPADQVPSCGPGLDYLLDAFGPFEALKKVFTGSGECADINWSFLGLSMPAWALVWFILLGGLAVLANWPRVSR